MKLLVMKKAANFGDQLNHLVFPRLLGPIFDEDRTFILLGIGTMIGARARAASHEIILGAGTGYQRRPSLKNRTVYTVRGPKTAQRLGVPELRASLDPGVLVARLYPSGQHEAPSGILFMPHWQTERAAGRQWRVACTMAGIDYLSPLDDTMTVLERLRACRLLITEALHGAIVAECYGRPWIPVVLGPKVLDFKWHDWCESIGTSYAPHDALPILHDSASIGGVDVLKRGLATVGLGKHNWRRIATRRTSQREQEGAAAELARVVARAEQRIHRRDRAIYDGAMERLLAAVDEFQRDRQAGRFTAQAAPRSA